MERIYLDRDWKFAEEYCDEMAEVAYDESAMEDVLIPHNVKDMPLHYFDESIYQMVSGYRRHIKIEKEWKGKSILLTFAGVAHQATVYVNGQEVAKHQCGYTAFTTDIAEYVNYGKDNVITVRCDSNENLNQPPFGFAIDYMTYGGIYRDVYLEVKEASHISRIAIDTKLSERYEEDGLMYCKRSAAYSKVHIVNPSDSMKLVQYLRRKGQGEYYKAGEEQVTGRVTIVKASDSEVTLWEPENPALYELKTDLIDEDGNIIDSMVTTFGYRKAVFKTNGFYLNGKKYKIRGLNRHQSYAYVGYAMPDSMQKFDAEILKYELGLNAVRTSHYPQDQAFFDKCDEIGLLVFTEIPGWQHIGGDDWKDIAVNNVKDMIRQNINHPSIILWGVRINESVDDEKFYERTNIMAHKEDPSRQTGGVRCYKKGIFQEDVFTFNDFSHYGTNAGVSKKASVTPDVKKPYLISEYNGHMFPTKAYDSEEHRQEHMLRHANVLNGAAGESNIAGSFGWCMFDYNTHKDFGSGDRICYHGVCDIFRNPKLAAYLYAAQSDATPVLELSSAMNIGEHPGGNVGDVYIITNADHVKMYKNDELLKVYSAKDTKYKNIPHGPIKIDDYIGNALVEKEGMPYKKAEDIKGLLNQVAGVGLYKLSPAFMLKAGYLAAKYHMQMTDAVNLYNKYIGNWGGKAVSYRFEAVKEGKVVKELVVSTSTKPHLELKASSQVLKETKTYDVAAVRIRALDENGGLLNFYNDPITLEADGPIEIIGPKVISLQGGMGGTYVKTTGKSGKAYLNVTNNMGETIWIEFDVEA